MDFKKLLQTIDSIEGKKQLNESKEDYEYYFGKDKKQSDTGKDRETGTGHMAKKTDKGTQYTKKDLPGQDTSKDADTKAAEKRAKKKASEDIADLLRHLNAITEAKKEEMGEEKTEEGNEFSGELAKAKAAGAKEFEVDGKKYQVKESEDEESEDDDKEEVKESIEDIYEAHVYHRVKADGKSEYRHHKTFKDEEAAQDYAKDWNKKHGDDKKTAVVKVKKIGETVDRNPYENLEECYDGAMMSQEQESGMSINASTDTRTGSKSLTVTAQGDAAEQLAQLLKLSGVSSNAPADDQVQVSMTNEYDNEPNVQVQGLEPQLQQGNDMHRQKTSYPKVAGGDNPMAMREAQELAEIERRLNEELAAFKVIAEKKGKPDFLDMDKDGDRKEPMKKAIADKSKKK